jgi:DNA-binding NarL/FixJ family response regulator
VRAGSARPASHPEELQSAGITVIAEVRDPRDCADLALHHRPEVVLIDVGRDGHSLAAVRRIPARAPEVATIMLADSDDVELGLKGLRAGAVGLVAKDVEAGELAQCVRRCAEGEPVASPLLVRRLIDYFRVFPEEGLGLRPVRSPLTSREWEVLDLLASGCGLDEIAVRFVIAPETVRTHVRNIMRKLDVRSQADAIRAAHRMRVPRPAGVGDPGVVPPASDHNSHYT